MSRPVRLALPFALAVALLAGGATRLPAGDAAREERTLKLLLRTDDGSERIEIDDLDDLAVGESRSFTTDSGKAVIVSREEDGYVVDLDGKTLRIGGPDAFDLAAGERRHHVRKIELDGDGAKSFVITDDVRGPRVVAREHVEGGHGFAFSTDGSPPRFHFGGPGVLDRVERHEKFLALDEATRELVREIVRESSQPLEWIEESEGDGDRVEVWIERRAPAADDE